MLTVETIAKIRRDYHVKKKGIKQIARERCVARNTIRKVIREDEVEFRYERKKPRTSKLDACCFYLKNNTEWKSRFRICVGYCSPRSGHSNILRNATGGCCAF